MEAVIPTPHCPPNLGRLQLLRSNEDTLHYFHELQGGEANIFNIHDVDVLAGGNEGYEQGNICFVRSLVDGKIAVMEWELLLRWTLIRWMPLPKGTLGQLSRFMIFLSV